MKYIPANSNADKIMHVFDMLKRLVEIISSLSFSAYLNNWGDTGSHFLLDKLDLSLEAPVQVKRLRAKAPFIS